MRSSAFRTEVNGFLVTYDYPAALATGMCPGRVHLFASNFDENSVPGAAGLGLKQSRQQEHHSERLQQLHASLRIRLVSCSQVCECRDPGRIRNVFYERITGGFANSLRQSPPFFRELQLNNLGNWNTLPAGYRVVASCRRMHDRLR